MIKFKGIIGVIASALFLVGCGSGMPSESNQLTSYEEGAVAATEDDMFQFSESTVPDGYFVKKGDHFYPILSYGIGSVNSKTFQWFQNYEKFIPELSAGDKLVLVSSDNIPGSFEFHKMEDLGTSIGMFFDVKDARSSDEDEGINMQNNITVRKSNVINPNTASLRNLKALPDSSIFTDIKSKDGLHPLTKDMLTSDGIVKGLAKDKPYELKFYLGTKFEEVALVADTRIFVSESRTTSNTVNKMQNVYFEIELPTNMETGYYVVNGVGSFFYNGN